MIQSLLPLRGRAKLEVEGMFRLKNEPGPGRCVVFGCRKWHIPETRGGKLHLCAGHYQERWRRLNPKPAAFATLRDHARSRRIPFSLTFAHFIEITEAAGFWDQDVQPFADRLSIDRILATGGYEDGNIQILTVSENVVKGNRERFLSTEVQAILAHRRSTPQEAWHMDEGKHWLDDPEDGDPF
jgi:hypothetical protein